MLRSMATSLLVFAITLPSQAQGILDRARQDADRAPAPEAKDTTDRKKSNSDPYDSGDWGSLGFNVLILPFWIPPVLLHDAFPEPGWFPGHPYALPDIGYIDRGSFRPDAKGLDPFDPQHVKSWATRASVEAGTDFSGLTRVGGRFALDTEWRVGVTSSLDYYRERLPCGCVDQTVLGDINLTVRFAQAEWVQMYTGLGARGMFDSDKTRGGVNFQYGADFFPADPVVVSTLFEMGNLDRAFVMRVRGSVGIQLRHAELFAGYDWLRIGSVDLHGPMVGLRLWF